MPLLILSGSYSWGCYVRQHFLPVRCVIPFSKYLIDRYIFRRGDEAKYHQILEVFIDVPELRSLAVPHDKGGPMNQHVFVVEGFAFLLSLFLVAFPLSGIQIIGFIISASSTFGYMTSLRMFDDIPYFSQEYGQFGCIIVSFLGILSIII